MMKIVERKCPVGKWRFVFRETGGHDVVSVAIKGQRRPWPLAEVSLDEFTQRVPVDQHGNPYEAAAIMWGIPTKYTQQGQYIYIWPAPSHEWTLQVALRAREKVE